MANWDEIQKEWETTKITLADLAEKHDIKLGTLKSRKSREKWSRDATEKDATKTKKVATVKEDATEEEIIYFEAEGDDGLTDKQRLFCMYYVKCFNQTVAAIKAGYARDSAHVEGSRLLRNAKVVGEVKRLKGELRKGLFIDAMDVLEKYVQIAFADVTDYVEFGRERVQLIGTFGPVTDKDDKPVMIDQDFVRFKEHDEVDGTIVTEIKMGKDGASIKLADKMRALDFLAKHFDLLNERERKQLQNEQAKLNIDKTKEEVKKIASQNTPNTSTEDKLKGYFEALQGAFKNE